MVDCGTDEEDGPVTWETLDLLRESSGREPRQPTPRSGASGGAVHGSRRTKHPAGVGNGEGRPEPGRNSTDETRESYGRI